MRRLLSLLMLLTVFLSLLTPCAAAEDTLTWNLVSDTLYISGKGEMHDFSSDVAPWRKYKDQITAIYVEEGVKSIGDQAFQYLDKVTWVSLPSSLRRIGNSAFYKCTSLREVYLPSGLTELEYSAFDHCSSLLSISLPDGITEIENAVFNCCESLESIYIPASVYEIEDSAFNSCGNLKTVYYGGSERQWRDIEIEGYNKALSRARTVYYASPEDAAAVQTPAQPSNTKRNVTWNLTGDTLTISGSGAMPDYSTATPPWEKQKNSIKHIVIDSGITHVGAQCFQYCSKLKTVSLPYTVTSIGKAAFYKCGSLREIELPGNLSFLGDQAFDHCEDLVSVEIPEGVSRLGDSVFNCCEDLRSVTIPVSVTEIGNSAFNGCSKLRDVYYNGGSRDWAGIRISSYNKALTNASIHTTDSVGTGIGGVL